jgi:hypothetical protein
MIRAHRRHARAPLTAKGVRADLATDSDVRTTALAAPDGIVFFDPLALMGVGGVLLVEADAADGTQVVIVGTDGTVRRLSSDIWPSVTAATSGTAARNPQIAFAGHRGIEPCGDGMDVVVVDATTGQTVLADTDALRAGADGPLVDDLWWGPDGALYATIRSLDCDNRERGLAMQPSLWRLDGTRWTNADPKSLNAVRWLSADTRAIVEAQSADGPFAAPGRLYVRPPGGALLSPTTCSWWMRSFRPVI